VSQATLQARQLQPWDRAADIVTILLTPGMPWHDIEAALKAAASGYATRTFNLDLS